MLHGGFQVKVDEKGRVKLPSLFRKEFTERFGDGAFYVTSVRGDCAHIYPARAWEEVLTRLSAQAASKPPVAKFRRVTSYFGQVVPMDPQGRLVIPPKLRDAAQIADDVIILGQNNHLEVWNLERFQQTLVADPITAEDEDYLATLGI